MSKQRTVRPAVTQFESHDPLEYVQAHKIYTLTLLDKATNPFEFMNICGIHEGVITATFGLVGLEPENVANAIEAFRRLTILRYPHVWEKIKEIGGL